MMRVQTVRPPETWEIHSPEKPPLNQRRSSYEAYQVLHFLYMILPIVAGIDKFLRLLINWEVYVSTALWRSLPMTLHHFILCVGVVEIALGLLIAARPRLGGYAFMVWLWLVILNLLAIPG